MYGTKYPLKYNSIIDQIILIFAEKMKCSFKQMGFNPNGITSLSLLASCLMLHYLIKKKYKLASIFLFLSYFFDCLDGLFARSYNMVTKFGDYYDHLSDLLTIIFIIYGLYNSSLKVKTKKTIFLITFILGLIASTHMGCLHNMYEKKFESPTLDILGGLCKNSNWALDLKEYGMGTFVFIVVILIFNIEKIDNIL